MATKTTWLDKNNDQHEGWIIDGKTYMDEAGTARVPIGATVNTAGGTFKMTSNGGIPTYQTAKTQYQSAAQAALNAYKAAGSAQESRIKYATDAAIAEFNRQKGIAQQNRQDADKAAREAYMKAANPFGAMEEQRVKLGLDESGYAESSKLKLASAYAGQINENYRAMNEQLQLLDVQIAEARASGQYELANVLEARAQNILQQEISLQNNIFSGDMQAMGQAESTRQFDEQMAYNRELEKKQWDYSVANDEYNKALNKAQTLAQFGNFDGYRALGYTDEQIRTMQSAYAAQAAAARSGGGGGGSGIKKTEKPVLTFAQVNEAIENGNITPNVLSAYEYYYGEAYGSDNGVNKNADGINYGSEYNTVYSQLRNLEKNGGSPEQAIKILQRAIDAGTLTDAGYLKLEQYFKKLLGA